MECYFIDNYCFEENTLTKVFFNEKLLVDYLEFDGKYHHFIEKSTGNKYKSIFDWAFIVNNEDTDKKLGKIASYEKKIKDLKDKINFIYEGMFLLKEKDNDSI